MALDPKFIGKEYGPYRYEVGAEKVREFGYAIGGTIPTTGFLSQGAPDDLNRWHYDAEAAATSPYKSIIAPPSFAVVFAITPFGNACTDPELGINLLMLVHGEQEFEFHNVIRPGDVLTTKGRISNIMTKAGKDFLTVQSTSHNQRGELVVSATWTAVIRGA